ncbi:MAG: SDR family oxidoreductase [Gammaproteobacteria bacterium]|nr:SDR family oxidoreductase [Gammaproteobacteria bacterium]
MDLNQVKAVVTGGASGLGLACVNLLKAHGAKVVSWDMQAAKTNDDIECDVSREDSVKQALLSTLERISCPNVCIQCAGIAPAKRVVGKDGAQALEDFQRVIDINLNGSFNVLRLVAAHMIQHQQAGCFILTASVAAFEGQIGQAAYSASKGGIVAMTLPIAREFAKHQIRVNTIAPGIMNTPMMQAMPEEVQTSLAENVPYPHRLGFPDEYAKLALHMIENDYLNAAVIRLDGGLRMNAG